MLSQQIQAVHYYQ